MIDDEKLKGLFDRAISLSQRKQHGEAQQIYTQITDAYPMIFEAWFNRAIASEEMHDIEGSIECYYRAVDLRPNHVAATRGLAVMLCNGRHFARALYWIEKSIQAGDQHHALSILHRRCLAEAAGSPLVFISYSWADRDKVEKELLPVLQEKGIDYFLDRRRIPQGEEMGELRWQLEVGIAQSTVFLLTWSASGSRSHFVHQELCSALAMMKRVIPVPVDGTPLPPWIRGSVAKHLLAPIAISNCLQLVNALTAKDSVVDRVKAANQNVSLSVEKVLGADFELITLDGGYLPNFAIGKVPVTQAQWIAVMGTNPSVHLGDNTRPVESVSWHEAQEFLSRLSVATGQQYRFPNEPEWEFACRAGSFGNWCFGDQEQQLHEFAWFMDNAGIGSDAGLAFGSVDGVSFGPIETSPHRTNSVLTKRPNKWGIFHMHGNVSEWCSDDAAFHPGRKPVRGGSYRNGPRNLRCAARGAFEADGRDDDVGFRICRDA